MIQDVATLLTALWEGSYQKLKQAISTPYFTSEGGLFSPYVTF